MTPEPPYDEEDVIWAWLCVAGMLAVIFQPWLMRWLLGCWGS